MRYLTDVATWIVGGIGTMYAFVTGHTDQAFQILLAMMIVDIVSGLLKGAQQGRLKSAIMSLGILKKGGILISILFAYLLDMLVNSGNTVFVTMMTWLAIGNEGLSIVENLSILGVKIPDALTNRLGQLKDQASDIQKEKDKPAE